ncbi:LPS export ABC transporter periplasmic protein LptC [Moraxella ovis]|uniref:LPS export ABC transporter periplasmic protein LptC n=1 Tax=Moraxella ovis TaxID=29433 RepID=UPI000D902DB4|nr:LPS export ABC transporter periplasmic protein LptC [Moraxella ovis]SPX84427.1 Uncharacterized protein conserved in bacteria [Moraxella ovis]STZ06993.1 Uncharacterized protein conserved in bacteria [Moraxella ovis]
MNVRILSVLGVMVIMVAAWFFYQEDPKIEPTVPAKPDVSYEVTEIKAVQTNEETGETEYTLTADSLVQNASGEDEMLVAVMNWQPPEGEKYIIEAKRAVLEQSTGDMALSDGFTLTREAVDNKPKLVITGNKLSGNTKSRMLSSDEPLTVVNGEDCFKAQGFSANLQTGEYEFSKIEVLYNSAPRQDKSLF